MKKLISSYGFDKTSGTVTLSGYTTVYPEGLLLITNVTDNLMIFNFADTSKKATVISGNVIDLQYDTSSMSNSDDLQIFYDDGLVQSVTIDSSDEMTVLLRRIVKLLEVGATPDAKNRQRVVIDAVGTVVATGLATEVTTTIPIAGAVTTSVSGNTITNIPLNSAPISGYVNLYGDMARDAYANGIRQNLAW